MQIPDEIRKCVGFVCYKTADGIKLAGTAFFVGVPWEGSQRSFVYVVTAKHIIDAIETRSVDKIAYLRMNLKDKGAGFIPAAIDKWVSHPRESNVDVAALPWAPSEAKFDYLSLPVKYALTEDIIKQENIGAGDDVFLVGLFVNHFGSERNLPIIRVGNIASMPEEKVHTRYGDVDAYLVEARSIGGLSGSPVFAYIGDMRKIGGSTQLGRPGRPLLYWLGLMHGHFNLSTVGVDKLAEDSLTKVGVNTGIAVVVPTWKILEVINQEVFMKAREEIIRKGAGE